MGRPRTGAPYRSAGTKELVALHPPLCGDELAVVARTRRVGCDVVLAVSSSGECRHAVRAAEQSGRVDRVVERARKRLHAVDGDRRLPHERLLDSRWELPEVLLPLLGDLEERA